MLLFNTVICDSRARLVSHSMDAMPIATEDPWKVARWPEKCQWRYSRACWLPTGLPYETAPTSTTRRVTTSPKIPLVYNKIPTVPNSSGGWTLK